MPVPILQERLPGRQVPSPCANAWERSEGRCTGCRQCCSALLCNVLIKLGKASQSEGISSPIYVMTLANSLNFVIRGVLHISSQFGVQRDSYP